jgi:hypothetical protein
MVVSWVGPKVNYRSSSGMGDIFDPREREGRFQWPHIKAMSWYLCGHDKDKERSF